MATIKEKLKVKKSRSGLKAKFVPKPPEDPAVIEARWAKKKDRIHKLANDISRLRLNVSKDLKLQGKDEKTFLTALIIAIQDKTGERIGNNDSAAIGHFGVSGFLKRHISISGNEITLKYRGKSGVDHEKIFSSEKIAKALKWAIKNSPESHVFTTSDGQWIGSDQVNKYLSAFDVSSKNLRGFFINKALTDKLHAIPIPEKEKDRKKIFNSLCKKIASTVGHGAGTCKKHYIVPELPEQYIVHGKIIDLKSQKYYKDGGMLSHSENRLENGDLSVVATYPDKKWEYAKKKKASGFVADASFSNPTQQSPADRTISESSGDVDDFRMHNKSSNNFDTRLENGGNIENKNYRNIFDIPREERIQFIKNILINNPYYSEKTSDFNSLAIKTNEFIDLHLRFDKYNPIVTKFNDIAYFEPDKRHTEREGYLIAQVEYALHFITNSSEDKKQRYYDKSKYEYIQFNIQNRTTILFFHYVFYIDDAIVFLLVKFFIWIF